ncbi:hypothetical protein EMCRGX_G019444 [Ephydatia muelleri]
MTFVLSMVYGVI